MKNYQFTDKYLKRLAKTIDNALYSNNEKILKKFVKNYPQKMEKIKKAYGFYLIGNTYSGLEEIEHNKDKNKEWSLEQKETFKKIYYLRKAMQQEDFENLDLHPKLGIYTNLGNAFKYYGRTINALKYYDKAINLKNSKENIIDYYNILRNKTKILIEYTSLDCNIEHRKYFIQFACKINEEARQIGENIPDDVQAVIDYMEIAMSCREFSPYGIEYFINYKTNFSKNENIYRKWSLEKKLFLNSLNDLGNYDIATYDTLNLPNLTTKTIESFPTIITNFSQIKQEYITYRYLLFEGIYKKTPKFYDKKTFITDDFDFNLYNINIEKIKIAFRGLYSIFDKIAYFLNEYFYINKEPNKVNFRQIWIRNENINNICNKSQNLALRGLYLISKDLFFDKDDENSKDFIEVIEPEAKQINKIRNHLEHKFISIKSLNSKIFESNEEKESNFSITKDELEKKTIHLAQLVREAIIYLSFTVNIEENKKNTE